MRLLGAAESTRGKRTYAVAQAVPRIAILSLLLGNVAGCSRGDAKAGDATLVAASQSVRSSSSCPSYDRSTAGWQTTKTNDGRLSLQLPAAYQAIRTESGQTWASSAASIGYRYSTGESVTDDTTVSRFPSRQRCEENTASGGRLRYYYAQAATGEGHYLQAVFSLADGSTIRLTGFARSPADGTELLAIGRSARPVVR
jgi:hypothetical protein